MQGKTSATIQTISCLCIAKRLWTTIRSCYNLIQTIMIRLRTSAYRCTLQPHSNNHDSDMYFRVHSFHMYVSTARLNIILPYTPRCLCFGFCHQNPVCISLPCFDHPNSICKRIQSLTLVAQFVPASRCFFTFSSSLLITEFSNILCLGLRSSKTSHVCLHYSRSVRHQVSHLCNTTVVIVLYI